MLGVKDYYDFKPRKPEKQKVYSLRAINNRKNPTDATVGKLKVKQIRA